jgi:hypothetical protein
MFKNYILYVVNLSSNNRLKKELIDLGTEFNQNCIAYAKAGEKEPYYLIATTANIVCFYDKEDKAIEALAIE